MLWKIVILFLCAMVLIAMLGKLFFPNSRGIGMAKCSACGKPKIGMQPCRCKGGRA